MGIAGSPDIFQAKMSELMVALEFVRTFLDDLLCVTKASLDSHLNHLRLETSPYQVARIGLENHCPQIEILW